MEKLIVNDFRYTHTTVYTTLFGGKVEEHELLKHTWPTGPIQKLTTPEWDAEILRLYEILGKDKMNNTEWDFTYYNGLLLE
jgi:hypothetical protein